MKKEDKKIGIKKRGIGRRSVAILVVSGMLICGGAASYAAFGEQMGDAAGNMVENVGSGIKKILGGDEQKNTKPGVSSAAEIKKNKEQQKQELNEKAKDIAVPDAVKAKLDGKPKRKLSGAYQRLVAEKQIPPTQKQRLEEYLVNYDDPYIVLSLYDYLYDKFFTYADLDAALARYAEGEALDVILQGYVDTDDSFVARDYEHEELERLVTTPTLAIADIEIAEILSFRGTADFHEVIEAKMAGTSWEALSDRYGVINGTGTRKSVTITSSEVNECMRALGIDEKAAAKKIVNVRLAEVETDDAVQFLQSGKSMGKVFLEHAQQKLEQ